MRRVAMWHVAEGAARAMAVEFTVRLRLTAHTAFRHLELLTKACHRPVPDVRLIRHGKKQEQENRHGAV